jgi:hypothetical protein
VIAVLDQAVTGVAADVSAVQNPPSSKFVLFVGHDANLYALFRWFGVNTQPYKQPRNTPGFINYLFLELWQDSVTSAYFVRMVYHSPPVQALRDLVDPTTLPTSTRWSNYRSIVEIPGCAVAPTMMCPYPTFKKLILDTLAGQLKPACISEDHLSLLYSLQGLSPSNIPTSVPISTPSSVVSTPSQSPVNKPSLSLIFATGVGRHSIKASYKFFIIIYFLIGTDVTNMSMIYVGGRLATDIILSIHVKEFH